MPRLRTSRYRLKAFCEERQSAFFIQKYKEVKTMERTQISFEELKQAAEPLKALLRNKGHPHLTVVVSDERVDLMEGIMGIPFEPIQD